MQKKRLGVVVGRFQLDLLHDAHKDLIRYVQGRNDRTIIYVGTSEVPISQRNPLSYFCRVDAIQTDFPEAEIYPIKDYKSDKVWSDVLDTHLEKNFGEYDICLYGSRDSFITSYKGKFRCEYIQETQGHIAANLIRKGIGKYIVNSQDFRKGIIYGSLNRFPISYQTVDIACIKEMGTQRLLLLGKKPHEEKLRFPGGFVDVRDSSLEEAALRELIEECGDFKVSYPEYIGSMRVDDWRYKNEVDKIMTSLYFCRHIEGTITAGDDLAFCKLVRFEDLNADLFEPAHVPLYELFKTKFKL